MTQPTQADQATLKFTIEGAPALGYYIGTPNTTPTLKFTFGGLPLYAPGAVAAPAAAARPMVFVCS